MIELALLLIAVGLFACFVDLRVGLYATVAAGLLQDPLRKLIPGEPVYVTALVAVFAAVVFFGGLLRGQIQGLGALAGTDNRLRAPLEVFIFVIAAQSIVTLVTTGSGILAAIGLLIYLSPVGGLFLGYAFATRPERVAGLLWVYVALAALMMSGVYFSVAGFEWEILRPVGDPLFAYFLETGVATILPSGFFRAPEIAAWHGAAGALLALVLGASSRRGRSIALGGALFVFFAVGVYLTGRRKFLIELAVFLPVCWLLLKHFRIGAARLLPGIAVGAVFMVFVAGWGIFTNDTVDTLREARQRSEEPIVVQAVERVLDVTVYSIPDTLDRNGFWGAGAGVGSQGAQHFGGGDLIVGYGGEGGIGKLITELGVPGALVFVWLAVALARRTWRTLVIAARGSFRAAIFSVGLAAFLLSNAAVFVGAHQAYGDVTVVLLLGLCLGFVLASGRYGGAEAVSGGLPGANGARAQNWRTAP